MATESSITPEQLPGVFHLNYNIYKLELSMYLFTVRTSRNQKFSYVTHNKVPSSDQLCLSLN